MRCYADKNLYLQKFFAHVSNVEMYKSMWAVKLSYALKYGDIVKKYRTAKLLL